MRDYPTITFYLNRDRGGDDKAVIYVRLTYYSGPIRFSTGFIIDPEKWDNDREVLKSRDRVSFHANKELAFIKANLLHAYDRLKLKGKFFSAKEILAEYKGESLQPKLITFNDLVISHKETTAVVDNTYKQYSSMLKLFNEFLLTKMDYQHIQNMRVEDIDLGLVNQFENFLRIYIKSPLKPSTRKEYLNKLRALLEYAKDSGFIEKNPTKEMKFKTLEKEIKQMERIERKIPGEILRKIETVEGLQPTVLKARLLFLWQTWTGMSSIDVYNWFANDRTPITSIDNGKYGEYKRHKTGIQAQFIWFDQVNKLAHLVKSLKLGFGPNYDAWYQSYEAALKTLSNNIMMFDNHLKTHDARHTFGVRMLDKGYSIHSVSKMLGHKTIAETEKTYVKVDISNIAKEHKRLTA